MVAGDIKARVGSICQYLQHPGSVVGASGALFSILVAFGMYFPDTQLMLLIPPIPMKAKYMVILCIALEFYARTWGRDSDSTLCAFRRYPVWF
ncbi:MAG: rhomboid family intramembrane serine protease [Saprospiraceae bacterium]|nr:rhomboid family intramembrane serine protease [Saprospiraceae bacterium]